MTTETWKNNLFFGDNLGILRESVASESVDLVYLDPLNSNATYNGLFGEKRGGRLAVWAAIARAFLVTKQLVFMAGSKIMHG